MFSRLKNKIVLPFAVLAALYLILLIPLPEKESKIIVPSEKPFLWNKDDFWNYLEQIFLEAKQMNESELEGKFATLSAKSEQFLTFDFIVPIQPGNPILDNITTNFFMLAPIVAVQQNHLQWYIDYYNDTRKYIKDVSMNWDMNTTEARNAIYKVLYGMRAAVEEVLLQSRDLNFDPVMHVTDEQSSTPFADLLGIKIHSGDILLSRGGAEVSALISRGNDYPGNFSHVALAYVDENNKKLQFIESHIERGVAIANSDEYIKDKKLRFMVLRLRTYMKEMKAEPMLPHKAAKFAYEAANNRHIPYDFKMNFHDTTAMFCSEVASYAYNHFGIPLWQSVSTISSQGIIDWLNDFGVENFVTQMPSDLEYDPQLSVVVEWRDPETLFKDHIDNAVIDVMFERANGGEKLDYNIFMLPVARVIKAWCYILNIFGGEGIIPEGMSATQALKNTYFEDMHISIKQKTGELIEGFIAEKGYVPPYWQIVKLAEEAANSL